MADVQSSARTVPSTRKPRSGRLSTRIDFTPMVDLGFLLITFFMLTTVLAKPTVMPLVMPKNDGENVAIKQSKVLTLLLGAKDKIYWYEGQDLNQLDSTGYDPKGLRRVILQKMDKVEAQWGLQNYADTKTGTLLQGSQLNVIIKPAKNARYKNLVDVLDEMVICQVRFYCILNVTDSELLLF